MTPALLAGAAAAAGVFALWEALAATAPWRRSGVPGRLLQALLAADGETAAERRRLTAVAAVTLLAGGALLAGPVAGVLTAVLAPWGVRAGLRWRRRRARARLAAGMPAAARALADALTGGHALLGALEAAGDHTPGPAGLRLRAAGRAVRLGAPAEDAVRGLRDEAGDPAWEAMVTAILLQRTAGGDLAGLLRTLADGAEHGARAEAGARAALAQARATAQLIAGVPLLGFLGLAFLSPGTVAAIAARPAALGLLVAAALLGLLAGALLLGLARSVQR